MKRFWITVLSLLPGGYAAMASDYYEASIHDSTWELSNSATRCLLTHPIPGFGKAIFRHEAGDMLQFILQTEQAALPITRASLSARPPAWMHGYDNYQNYPVSSEQISRYSVNRSLMVSGETAELMLSELGRGRWPTFTYLQHSGNEYGNETRVAISAVNFVDQYNSFHDCRRDLPPFGLSQLKNMVLFFNSGQKELSPDALQQLDHLVGYLGVVKKADIVITSGIRSGSQLDKKWWASRSAVVKSYLQQAGIDEKLIKAQYQDAATSAIEVRLMGPEDLRTYYYQDKSPSLGPKSLQRLEMLAEYIKSYYPQGRIVISSYTDTRGGASNNLKLSQLRADQIKRYFEGQGIDSQRISIRAYGESRSAQYYREQSAVSRRVEIDLVS